MRIFTTLICCFLAVWGFSQTETLLDFETPETSTLFYYFGSDLQDQPNSIIANPDPTGINTSAMVADFTHPNNGELWAGAYSNPAVQTNTNNAIEVCMKVWFSEPGNVALKLENEQGGLGNWILQQEVNETQSWTNVCFDLATPSIEDPGGTALNGIFDGFVLFFDFQTIPLETKVYYFDDVVITYGDVPDVTSEFTVDMNSYVNEIDEVLIRGTFNGWSEDNVMTDNGDGTWSTSITGPAGVVEYKYYVRAGDVWEEFSALDECVAVSGDFVNRQGTMTDGGVIASCWNSCYACDDRAAIRFELGFPDGVVPADSVYLAGGGNFDAPGGRFLMDDSDGDGIYTITVNRSLGFSSFYTFANGPCGDWSCKENISGLDCANPDNFNDRFLEPLTGETVISTCFGECTEDTNCTALQVVNVTWQVDMTQSEISSEGVFYAGQLTGWGNEAMSDSDGDGIYEISFPVEPGNYEYKFKNGENGWEEFADDDPCTTTFDDGGGNVFVNRLLVVDSAATDFATVAYCFNACAECIVATNDLEINDNLFAVRPSISEGDFVLEFETILDMKLSVVDINGQVQEVILPTDKTMEVDFSHLAKGMYFINAQTEKYFKTSRIIIQ